MKVPIPCSDWAGFGDVVEEIGFLPSASGLALCT